jgi:hypothetical protein
MWEHTPPGASCAGEQSALMGRRGHQELLISMYVPGSTALAGRRGPQELLIGTYVPGGTFKSLGARTYFGALAEQRPLLEPFLCRGAIV